MSLAAPIIRSGLGSESNIVIQGYLLKKGRTFDQWKRKYYILRSHCIWYYNSSKDDKLLGQISVLGASIAIVNKYKDRQFVFSVLVGGSLRYFSATSIDEMGRWVKAIESEAKKD